MARTSFIEAIDLANDKKFDQAMEKISEGDTYFKEGHKAHAELIQKEAGGEKTVVDLLIVHAEDQMMSAETFKILAEKFIDLNKKLV